MLGRLFYVRFFIKNPPDCIILHKNLVGIIILFTFAAVFTNVARMYEKSD